MLRPTPSNLAPQQRIRTHIDLKIQSSAAHGSADHGYVDVVWMLHIDGCGGEFVVSVSDPGAGMRGEDA